MKNATLLLTFSTLLVGFSLQSKAQASASATANATATIVTPITITKNTDLEFGNVAVSATVPGTVVMTPAGVRTPSGGVTLPNTTGTVTAASFLVEGVAGYAYSITLPSTAVNLVLTGAPNMTVTAFTSTPSLNGTLDTNGEETLNVGGTLNVAAGQPAGDYATTVPFTVTVNYN